MLGRVVAKGAVDTEGCGGACVTPAALGCLLLFLQKAGKGCRLPSNGCHAAACSRGFDLRGSYLGKHENRRPPRLPTHAHAN